MASSSTVAKQKSSPARRLDGFTALVLVAGLVVGFGLGFLVERSRIRTKHKAKKTAVVAKTPVSGIGTVSAATAKLVTINTAKGVTLRYVLGSGSLIVQASRGGGDVVAGARVFYKSGGKLTAREIVVLRGAQARAGAIVTGATPTSMTFKFAGKAVTVNRSGAVVDTVAAGTKADVTKGRKVIVEGRRVGAGVLVTELIVLPTNTSFG